MALLPEELSSYSTSGLMAMSDLLVKINEVRAPNYSLPVKFQQSLEKLRWETDRDMNAGLEDIEAFEARVMVPAVEASVR